MTPNEARVAIAKDVIAHIKTLKLTRRVYWQVKNEFDNINFDNDVDVITAKCEVCALGSCMLSYIRLFSNAPQYFRHGEFKSHLKKFFPIKQLEQIEQAFEWNGEFAQKYPNLNDRLEAIMSNIIANEGDFIWGYGTAGNCIG